ncbi:hypothetical protein DA075_09935 [Methylobacterium currus]|uniref:Uncharacterized protein n=1 Tax=Methylobacterium currus TaxID=2051553 RepID=A0A2R4WI24_9HYPH|nr:hypothetical protein [Methylobacterium currus]AWB21192.1 hypothetical protein DA075_09935 [Methylobacterium currus]
MRLWEANHSYYCSESNFYSRDPHTKWDMWSSFVEEFGNSDLDYNLVFRWDWYEGDDWGAGEYNGDDYYRNGRLLMFFIMQRKGIFACHEISVCRADEPSVITFLKPRLAYLRDLWAPLDSAAGIPVHTVGGDDVG